MRIPGSSALSAVAWLLLRGYAARVYEDPVLSVLSWRDESEAIALAKATEYGLTASILTNNVRTAFSAARGQVRLCLDQRRFGPLLRRTFRRLQEQPGAYLNTGDRMPFGLLCVLMPITADWSGGPLLPRPQP